MVPIVSITGYAKSGKTTLMLELIKALQAKGYKVAVIKHDPHDHGEVDRRGSDTAKYWEAGCRAAVLSSPTRLTLFRGVEKDTSPEQIIPLCGGVDCVLLEGYKEQDYPKIVIWSGQKEILNAPGILAVIYNREDEKEFFAAREPGDKTPVFTRADLPGIVSFLEKNCIQKR